MTLNLAVDKMTNYLKLFNTSEAEIEEISEEQAKEKLEPVPACKNMSVDEVSNRKYHHYLTNVISFYQLIIGFNIYIRNHPMLIYWHLSKCEYLDANCRFVK